MPDNRPVPRQRSTGNQRPPEQYQRPPRCWYCRRPNVIGSDQLGSSMGQTTRIDVCEDGTGCRDGRIYHGPTGPAPHKPGEPCRECDRNRNERKE